MGGKKTSDCTFQHISTLMVYVVPNIHLILLFNSSQVAPAIIWALQCKLQCHCSATAAH